MQSCGSVGQITQTAMTAVDFFKSIAPKTNFQPVNNTPQPNNEDDEKK